MIIIEDQKDNRVVIKSCQFSFPNYFAIMNN